MTVARDFRVRLITDPNEIVRCRSPQQKPFLRYIFDNGVVLEMPLTLPTRLWDESHIIINMHELRNSPIIPHRKNKPKEKSDE